MTDPLGHDLEPSARLRSDGRLLAVWHERTGVEVEWDKRSLQDFESFPVEELARAYDLIVIDHPHVGQITGEGCLEPLDVPGRETELCGARGRKRRRVVPSYTWQGRQWALSDRCGGAGPGLRARTCCPRRRGAGTR